MSKRMDHILSVLDRFHCFVQVWVTGDQTLSVFEAETLLRSACEDIADAEHVRFSTIWSQMTRELDLSADELYELVLDHLTTEDKMNSRLCHVLCRHCGAYDSEEYIRKQMQCI